MTNTVLLEQRIKESGLKIASICEMMEMPYSTFYNKVHNNTEFVASEIIKLCGILKISKREREVIFFTTNVDK